MHGLIEGAEGHGGKIFLLGDVNEPFHGRLPLL